jgi:hypothetical protein
LRNGEAIALSLKSCDEQLFFVFHPCTAGSVEHDPPASIIQSSHHRACTSSAFILGWMCFVSGGEFHSSQSKIFT